LKEDLQADIDEVKAMIEEYKVNHPLTPELRSLIYDFDDEECLTLQPSAVPGMLRRIATEMDVIHDQTNVLSVRDSTRSNEGQRGGWGTRASILPKVPVFQRARSDGGYVQRGVLDYMSGKNEERDARLGRAQSAPPPSFDTHGLDGITVVENEGDEVSLAGNDSLSVAARSSASTPTREEDCEAHPHLGHAGSFIGVKGYLTGAGHSYEEDDAEELSREEIMTASENELRTMVRQMQRKLSATKGRLGDSEEEVSRLGKAMSDMAQG